MAFNGQVASPNDPRPPKEYEENGRWYHQWHKGKYMFPCDEEEKDRLDLFHKIFKVARKDELLGVPLTHTHGHAPIRILDLGCGTGIWCIDVSDHLDPGYVYLRGVDLILMQPNLIPPNVEFAQVDVETPWSGMGLASWNIIHIRTLKGSIQSWPQLYTQAFRHLIPRIGYLEQVEIDWIPRCDDGTLSETAAMVGWAHNLMGALDDHGRSMRIDSEVTKRQLGDAGFVDIKEQVVQLPINGWPTEQKAKELGRWFSVGLTTGLEALTLAPLARMRDKTKAEVTEIIEKVKKEMVNRNIHAYCNMYVWSARRPS